MPVSAYEQHQRTRASADSEEKPPKAPKKKAARKKRVAKKAVAKKKAPKKKAAKKKVLAGNAPSPEVWSAGDQRGADEAREAGIMGPDLSAELERLKAANEKIAGERDVARAERELSRVEQGKLFSALEDAAGKVKAAEEVNAVLEEELAKERANGSDVLTARLNGTLGQIESDKKLLERARSDREEKEAEIAQLRAEVDQRIEEFGAVAAERDSLAAEVKSLRGEKESEIAALRLEIFAMKETRKGLETDLLAKEQAQIREILELEQAQIRDILDLEEKLVYWKERSGMLQGLIREPDRQAEITAAKRAEGFRMNEFHPQDYRGALRRVALRLKRIFSFGW